MSKTPTEKTGREALKKGKTGLDATLIDQWMAEHYEGPEDILGKQGLLAQLAGPEGRGGRTEEHPAQRLLAAFAGSPLGQKYPMIAASWRRHWAEVIPFYDYPPEVRKMIYTTNAIESLNMQLCKIVAQWKKPSPHWGAAAHQLALSEHIQHGVIDGVVVAHSYFPSAESLS